MNFKVTKKGKWHSEIDGTLQIVTCALRTRVISCMQKSPRKLVFNRDVALNRKIYVNCEVIKINIE